MPIKQVKRCSLSEADVVRLITSEPNPEHKALFMLFYGAGLRVTEVCNLRWCDVRRSKGINQIVVRHHRLRTRTVTVSSGVWSGLQAIRKGPADDAPLFFGPKGQPLNSIAMRKIFRDAKSRIGLLSAHTLHDLRKAHVIHSHDHGAPRSSIEATMGYRSEIHDFVRRRPDSEPVPKVRFRDGA